MMQAFSSSQRAPAIAVQRVQRRRHHMAVCAAAGPEQSTSLSRRAALGILPAVLVPGRATAASTAGKRTGLSIEEVKNILAADLGERQYFVTGQLTKEIFADDCSFVDPTNSTVGLDRYLKAVDVLFDGKESELKLNKIEIVDGRTVRAEWTLSGVLKFPWRPRIQPFEGTATYYLNDDRLVQKQVETWNISGVQALLATFTPGGK